VFLPGMGEIKKLMSRVEGLGGLRGRSWILPLHSNVAPLDQKKAFQNPPPGVRKVVLATNIAETSLTIEDVVCCIDTGRLKEKRYDPKRCMSALVEDFISRDSSKQRKGRAGRVSEGLYIALFTRHRHDRLMRAHQVPEIHRIPLEELVLQVTSTTNP
jgi:ATP-dependent RNA helicase DHX29